MSEKNDIKNLYKALESDDYKWRSIKGLSKATGLDEKKVEELLSSMEDVVSTTSASGNSLFTTNKHYEENTSEIQKIFQGIKGKRL